MEFREGIMERKQDRNNRVEEGIEQGPDKWSEVSHRSGGTTPIVEVDESENREDSEEFYDNSPSRRGKRIAFMSYVEEGADLIGGCLVTDEELMPIEFIVTDYIKPPTKLQKILYGTQFDMKWFGDLIAGTLFEGVKQTENSNESKIEGIFVSDERLLHLRRKTGETPVAFITDKDMIIAHTHYPHDKETVPPILERVKRSSDVNEVLDRVNKGIKKKISSDFDGGQK